MQVCVSVGFIANGVLSQPATGAPHSQNDTFYTKEVHCVANLTHFERNILIFGPEKYARGSCQA